MTIYALLAAVSNYPDGVANLYGTLNDLRAFDTFFQMYKKRKGVVYKPYLLRDEECSRSELIKAFDHFKNAMPGDICFFYFSGHGSQTPAPPEFWDVDTNRMCETILCYDSRLLGGKDLANKEIAYLLHQHVPEGAQCLTIFDSCHSGTITRGEIGEYKENEIRRKHVRADGMPRGFDDFLGSGEYEGHGGFKKPKQRDHIRLSACLDRESAVELILEDEDRGLFTYALLKTLEHLDLSRLSYRELLERAQSQVGNVYGKQTVNGRAIGASVKLEQAFLSGYLGDNRLLLSFSEQENAWFIRRGSAHGVNHLSSISTEVDGEQRALTLRSISPGKTLVEPTDWLKGRSKSYYATVSGLSPEPMLVGRGPNVDNASWQKLVDASAGFSEQFVLEGAGAGARYQIKGSGDVMGLYEGDDPKPAFRRVSIDTTEGIENFLNGLRSVARYWQTKRLTSELNVFPINEAVEIHLEEIQLDANDVEILAEKRSLKDEVLLAYRLNERGDITRPRFRLKIKLREGYKPRFGHLYLGMLYFDETFGVYDTFMPMEELRPNEAYRRLYNVEKPTLDSLAVGIPMSFIRGWNIREITNHLKIIVSETPIDLMAFRQNGLPLPEPPGRRGPGEAEPLSTPKSIPGPPRWATKDITLRIVFPEALEYHYGAVTPGIAEVRGPAEFSLKKIEMTSSGSTVRSLAHRISKRSQAETPVGPQLEAFGVTPLDLRPAGTIPHIQSRGTEPIDDLMIIYNTKGYERVTPEDPLSFRMTDQQDPALVFGYDAESGLYFPAGATNEEGRVELFHLPAPTEDFHTRSIGVSIKLFFRRMRGKQFGRSGNEDQLREVKVAKDCAVTLLDRTPADGGLKRKVEEAEGPIALFIHGVIGNNSVSPGILQQAKYQEKPLLDQYDLVLAYDYENLNSSIDQIAVRLQDALEDIGLRPGHSKTLHIYAHSMGGLVSRHFIEILKGDSVVSHLIMFGTPNAGSPLPNAYAYMMTGVTALLSGAIPLYPWAAPLLAGVRWFSKGTQTAPQDMLPDSDFIAGLNTVRGKKIATPYSLVCGSTKLDKVAAESELVEASFFASLVNRHLLHSAVTAAFFREENDVAVSLESQQAVNASILAKEIVACNHLSYFVSLAGVKRLEEVLIALFNK